MRSLMILLLIVVAFLFGMLTGIDREKQVVVAEQPLEYSHKDSFIETDGSDTGALESIPQTRVNDEPFSKAEGPKQATHKTAFFLEGIVKGFYEIVVEVLYQITSLFV